MNSSASNTSPRVCFNRYNPYEPNGQSKVDWAQGIKWFLNLCASFEEHQKHFDEEQPLTWIQPFGAEKEGFMLGTEIFPVLVLKIKNYIPKQADGYNCGIATVATIGIVLWDFLQEEET